MISIGIDTGFTTALTWIEVASPTRPMLLGIRSLEVGHRVPLAKVRRNKRGSEQTEETIVDDADLRRLRCEVGDIFKEIVACTSGRPVRLTIERVERVKPRERFSAHMATCLVHSAWIGAEVAALGCAFFGPPSVSTVSEPDWRAAIIGNSYGFGQGAQLSDDQKLGYIIPAAIAGWPKRSSAHTRDGGGIALYGARRAQLSAIGAVSL